LYARARQGEIKDFTGISSPYEEPVQAELTIATGSQDIKESVDQVIAYLQQQKVIKS
jgi:adenylylsulfate kinase